MHTVSWMLTFAFRTISSAMFTLSTRSCIVPAFITLTGMLELSRGPYIRTIGYLPSGPIWAKRNKSERSVSQSARRGTKGQLSTNVLILYPVDRPLARDMKMAGGAYGFEHLTAIDLRGKVYLSGVQPQERLHGLPLDPQAISVRPKPR